MSRFRCLAISLIVLCSNASIAAAERRPNILFILADDLGWRDLSNEGSAYYESPHIDRIAREGMKFTRGYATCQVCSPSRASILTGKYTTKHGITTWIGDRSGKAWHSTRRRGGIVPVTKIRAFHCASLAGSGSLGPVQE